MPLFTPICAWCGESWLRLPRTVVTSGELFMPPATSTRWPSVHLHHECASEFFSSLPEAWATGIGKELDPKPGRDRNFKQPERWAMPRWAEDKQGL